MGEGGGLRWEAGGRGSVERRKMEGGRGGGPERVWQGVPANDTESGARTCMIEEDSH